MPTYEYYCPTNHQTVEVMHGMSRIVSTWGELCDLAETKPGKTLKDRELMVALEKLEAHIQAYRHPREGAIVGNVISVLDVIRESHRAVHGGGADAYRVPDTERGVADMMTLFENAGPDELSGAAARRSPGRSRGEGRRWR